MKTNMDVHSRKKVKITSMWFLGEKSPYPTVVIVANAKCIDQNHCRYG